MKYYLAYPKGLRISDCGLRNADCGLDQCVVEDVGLFNPKSAIRNPAGMQFSISDFGLNRYAVAEHSAFQSAIRIRLAGVSHQHEGEPGARMPVGLGLEVVDHRELCDLQSAGFGGAPSQLIIES